MTKDNDKNKDEGITFQRRDVLVGTALATIGSALGLSPGNVSAQSSTSIDSSGVPNDFKRQYNDGVNSLTLNTGAEQPIMNASGLVLDIPDRRIFGTVELAINRHILSDTSLPNELPSESDTSELFKSNHDGIAGIESGLGEEYSNIDLVASDFEEIAQASVERNNFHPDVGAGIVKFGGPNASDASQGYYGKLWDSGTDTGGSGENALPLKEAPILDDDYKQLGIISQNKLKGISPQGVPRNRNKIELRLRIGSTNGSINREEIVEFETDITPQLGTGTLFGANYGKKQIEDWEGNQYTIKQEDGSTVVKNN